MTSASHSLPPPRRAVDHLLPEAITALRGTTSVIATGIESQTGTGTEATTDTLRDTSECPALEPGASAREESFTV